MPPLNAQENKKGSTFNLMDKINRLTQQRLASEYIVDHIIETYNL